MKCDYFAFVFERHQQKIDEIFGKAKGNKDIKLQNFIEVIEKKPRQRSVNIDNLSELAKEPIKTHLLFKKLEEGKDSSWKSILSDFYTYRLDDFNKVMEDREKQFSFLDYTENFGFSKKLAFTLTLSSPFFTASENKFYSIQNPIAKEKPTGLPLLKGSSLKGALRQAAIYVIESGLLEKNYGDKFNDDLDKTDEEIEKIETEDKDRFFFEKRAQLVRLFGNEKDVKWFTFKSLLATGGIRDVSKTKEILEKISFAFKNYLKNRKITDNEGNSKGRLIFEDLHFKRVTLDVITPLDRKKRTPAHGPIFYEVVPGGETATGKIIWFPFDLIAKEVSKEDVDNAWEDDKKLIENAFKKLSEKGIGAKTKDGWGRFEWEEI
ncbi:RAMP superfamily protein [Desulfonauticus submarinus]|uniref:RAMP superfamily protein n=1 Tax=Desulfonauticus submarinus TaxID=206665 RepID=A0A1H0DNK9_9BACT|nr:RAMP superfamily CRISPR-associated protein [Desulfonauticus submarinus]SDN71659.1 RAMP superfamily protein [Desulfonauticus submarinus]